MSSETRSEHSISISDKFCRSDPFVRPHRPHRPHRPTWICAVVSSATFLVSLLQVQACPVCFLLPTKTTADYLIESDTVVLARENPHKPFSYSVVKILKGELATKEIDLFVDSATRRKLRFHPDHAVVLVNQGKAKKWRRLCIANQEYQDVIVRILAFSKEWSGNDGAGKRYQFFLSQFGNKNRSIHELSYLELGRAPYSTIKRMAKFVSKEKIRPMIDRREYYEWRSLAILMLAQNPTDADRKLIADSFASCKKHALATHLAAWATAYIELSGSDAIEEIQRAYLVNSRRTEAEVRAVIIALSVHGRNADARFREQIVGVYGTALQFHPQIAGLIASDLVDWNDRNFAQRMDRILKNPNIKFDPRETKAIKTYLEWLSKSDP